MTHRSAFVSVALLLSACGSWRGAAYGELGHPTDASEHQHALVVVPSRAFEVDDVHVEGGRLRGAVRHVWRIAHALDDRAAAALIDDDRDPDELAAALGWTLEPDDSPPWLDLDPARVRVARVYEGHPGRALAVGAVVTTSTAGAIGVIAFIILAASVSCGRPLRVRGRRCITPIVAADAGWYEPVVLGPVPDAVRATLVEIWTEEARAEHAAIAAFSKLALELIALGAPPALIARANRAAIQEVHHARLCFALASGYAGRALGPAPFPQALAGDRVDLTRVARESLLDGCLREGIAAEIARLGADHARDPEVVRVMRIQAREEAQHAALAWAIVDWCLGRGGDELRRELVSAIDEARVPRCDDLPAHGRVGYDVVTPYFDRLRASTRERLGEARTPRRALTRAAAWPARPGSPARSSPA